MIEADKIRCLACKVAVSHTEEQHQDYLSVWCDQHHSWCGDHTQHSIFDAINHMKQQRRQAAKTSSGSNISLRDLEQAS